MIYRIFAQVHSYTLKILRINSRYKEQENIFHRGLEAILLEVVMLKNVTVQLKLTTLLC